MALTDEATIGLITLMITFVVALGSFLTWLLRQHHRGIRGLREPEHGISRRQISTSTQAYPHTTSATSDADEAQSFDEMQPPGTFNVMTTTTAVPLAPFDTDSSITTPHVDTSVTH